MVLSGGHARTAPEDAPPEEDDIDQPAGARPDIYEYYGAGRAGKSSAPSPGTSSFSRRCGCSNASAPVSPWVAFENPTEEAVRFSCNPALVFPPSQIHSLNWVARASSRKMSVNFMGLVGQLGVLPLPYTEWVNDRLRAKRSYAAGVSRPVPPPHDLALLPGLGKVSLPGGFRARPR